MCTYLDMHFGTLNPIPNLQSAQAVWNRVEVSCTTEEQMGGLGNRTWFCKRKLKLRPHPTRNL